MISFILNWADKGIMILAALLLLRYYFNPANPRLYKKKWVLFASGFIFFYGIFNLVVAYKDYSESRIPSSEKLKETILSDGVVLSEDVTYSSSDGYQILIPAGYKYIKGQPGGLSLSAAREGAALLVAKMSDPKPLDELGNNIIEELKGRASESKLQLRHDISLNGADALRLDWELVRKGIPVNVIMVFVKQGGTLFHLTISCPKEFSKQSGPEFERIINSFILDTNVRRY